MAFEGKLIEPTTKRVWKYILLNGVQVYTPNYHDGFKAYHNIAIPYRTNIEYFPSFVLKP